MTVLNTLAQAISRRLCPEAHHAAERYYRLRGELDTARQWLGIQHPEGASVAQWALDRYHFYWTSRSKSVPLAEVEALLAAERERCAKVADTLQAEWWSLVDYQPTTKLAAWYRGRSGGAMKLAAAIRSLAPQTIGGERPAAPRKPIRREEWLA